MEMNRYRDLYSHCAGAASALRFVCDTEQKGGVWFFCFTLKEHVASYLCSSSYDGLRPEQTSLHMISTKTMSRC